MKIMSLSGMVEKRVTEWVRDKYLHAVSHYMRPIFYSISDKKTSSICELWVGRRIQTIYRIQLSLHELQMNKH